MLLIYLLLTLMVILWSFSFVLVDMVVDIIPPMSIAFNRFILASIAFLIIDLFLYIQKGRINRMVHKAVPPIKYTRKEWKYILIASFTGISLFFFAQYSAIELIGPSLPALFVCLFAPVIITIFALIFFEEKLTKRKILGFLIATIGGFLLISGGDISNLTPETPSFIGYIFALVTPLLWGIYSTVTKRIGKSYSNFKMLKIVAYCGTVELFIFLLINNELIIYLNNFFNIFVIISGIYLGIGCYIIGYYIWQKAQQELKSLKSASFLYIEPFLTLLLSFLLNRSENILIWNVIGGLIVLGAVIIINYK